MGSTKASHTWLLERNLENLEGGGLEIDIAKLGTQNLDMGGNQDCTTNIGEYKDAQYSKQ